MLKKLFSCLLLSVAFLSSYAQFDLYKQNRDSIQQLKIGALFPDFSLANTNGKIFTQKDLIGKITVINFWFESCVPCMGELDALNRLFLKFKDNPDFQFVSFTIDSLETAKKAIKKHGILFDVYPTIKKECTRLFCTGFPTNIIVDQTGKAIYIKSGVYSNEIQVHQMELLTAFLLKEKNLESPYLYSVSASSISPDSLKSGKPLTLREFYRMGILKEEDRDTVPIVGRKYMDFNATTLGRKNIFQKQLPGKVTVINIWEQNCAPCMAELEFFNELYLRYKNNSAFQLFTFTCDTEEDAKKVINEHNLLYDVACIDRNESNRLNFNNGFPTIIIIDQNGNVSYFDCGGYTEREKVSIYFKKLENEIDKLLRQFNYK